MTRSGLDYQQQDTRIDLAGILRSTYDQKWLIGGITTFCAVMGLLYGLLATPIYEAKAMIQIEPRKTGINGVPEVVSRANSVSLATSEIELIKSRAVLGQAVENLKLHITAEPRLFPLIGGFIARRHDPEWEGQLASAPPGLGAYAWGGERLKVFQLDVPEDYLGQELTLVAGGAGTFTLQDEDGAQLLDGRVREAVVRGGFKVQLAELVARPGTEFTLVRNRPENTALAYQRELKIGEAGRDSGIVYLTTAHKDPEQASAILDEIGRLYVRQNIERTSAEATQRLEFLRSQLPLVRRELEKAEAALNNYKTSARSVDISIETESVLKQIVDVEKVISEHMLKRVEYQRLYTEEHPTYQTLMTKIDQLEAEKATLLRKVESLPMTQQEVLRFKRDMEVTTETYTLLLNKVQEQDIIRAGAIGNVRIIDKAYAMVEKPAWPMRTLVLAIAVLGGLLASAVVILVRQAFYRGIEAPDAIERLGIPVYAALPHSTRQHQLERRSAKGEDQPRLLGLEAPTDLAIESLRSLRTSIKFAMIEARNHVVTITSPTPGVGKSFVAANLAMVIAQTGQRVLLIDADMRRGHLHKAVLGKLPNSGLSDALASALPLNAVATLTPVENLEFIARGSTPPNPSELLMHENFARLLREATEHYDLVIVDTPPVLAVTDAVVIAQHAGSSLLVARYGKSTSSQVETAKLRLAQNGVLLRGAIFNGVRRKASNSAFDTGAYGYYTYPQKA